LAYDGLGVVREVQAYVNGRRHGKQLGRFDEGAAEADVESFRIVGFGL
jgi:hypothetical protein